MNAPTPTKQDCRVPGLQPAACPFCNSELTEVVKVPQREEYVVRCTDCGAQGPCNTEARLTMGAWLWVRRACEIRRTAGQLLNLIS